MKFAPNFFRFVGFLLALAVISAGAYKILGPSSADVIEKAAEELIEIKLHIPTDVTEAALKAIEKSQQTDSK